jgi:hypothetical protein
LHRESLFLTIALGAGEQLSFLVMLFVISSLQSQ